MPTSKDIQDTFNIKYGCKLDDLLRLIKKECNEKGIPLLDNPQSTINSDFVDMIMYSVKSTTI
jgi:hypothetical protein